MPTFLGNPRSPIGAVSRGADKLDIFAVATDGNVYTAAWEPDFSGWHGWYLIGGATFPPGAPVYAVSRSTDKLDIFAADIYGRILTSAWMPGFTQWTTWRQVAGVATIPGAHVTAVSRSTDKLDIFVVGTDHTVYTAAWEPDFGQDWHGWYVIGRAALPLGVATFPPGCPVHAISRSTDKLDIFAVNDNFGAFVPSIVGTIMTSAWEPGFTQWSTWRQVANGAASPGAHVTAVSRSTDKLDIFVVSPDLQQPYGGGPGVDGLVFTAAWEPDFGADWHGWWPAFMAPELETRISDGGPIAAVSRSKDKIDVFACGIVESYSYTPGGPPPAQGVVTSAWPPLPPFNIPWVWTLVAGGNQKFDPGDQSSQPAVTAVSRNTDKLDIFFVGTDGNVWTAAWEPAFGQGNWHGWWTIGT